MNVAFFQVIHYKNVGWGLPHHYLSVGQGPPYKTVWRMICEIKEVLCPGSFIISSPSVQL